MYLCKRDSREARYSTGWSEAMRVKGQRTEQPRQPSAVTESCSFRLRQSTRQQDRGQLTIRSLLFTRWKPWREIGQTPARPSHCENPRRPAASAAHEKKKKKKTVFPFSSYGSGASEACLSVYSGLDSRLCATLLARPSQQQLESLPRLSECGGG